MTSAPFPPVIALADPGPAPETYRPAADRILTGDPVQSVSNRFSSSDGRFNCGIWTGAVGSWRVVFTENEFCQLLEGVVLVKGDDGSQRRFVAGDAFVMPAGFTGVWDILEPARKYYAVYE
ncbi:transcriptional regulator [Niveispirillum lacus]|uniref:Transcriptional regulator n=1 Tax=Niveispirillum lacus TaxID=1981099 RepID=A0A255YTS5_9PROT|nr:cupin domain-containing protein [Niveispirillum lacus]OYQ32589.1 transcriptional regulator [Niveispirillum lacus]